jgi:signal peptidase II
MRKAPYLLIGLIVLVIDQITKAMVLSSIPLGGGREITPWFSIIHWQNPGGLFGMMNQLPAVARVGVFLLLPLLGIALLGFLFAKSRRRIEWILLSAVLGGALGNMVDRFRFGSVVDFLDFHLPGGPAWPTFNVADASLSTGILLYLALVLLRPEPEGEHAPDSLHHR